MNIRLFLNRILLYCCFCVLVFAVVPAWAQQGYFHVEQRDGVWWLIDPSGNPTLSVGVDHISYEPDRIKGTGPCPYREALEKIYPDRNAWGLMALARIRMWGFNTIGAWSDPELWTRDIPYTIILDIAQRAGADWQHGRPVDVYDTRFEEAAREIAGHVCQPRRYDHALLGYFSDNELRWGPDWRGKETMLEMYLKLPAGAGGRAKAIEFLKERYGNDIGKLNEAWGVSATGFDGLSSGGTTDAYKADADQFLENVAARYFDVCAQAIREADPNHLYLGARFAGKPPDAVFRGAKAADVVSINIYSFDPRPLVKHIHALTGKPVMIGEFAFRAEDSGLPNTRGAGPKVPNQQARAKAYRDYVTWLESLPESVGYHWFEWVDEPQEGRFDGEDSNYGLVDINDKPYTEFVDAVKQANREALEFHQKAAK